MAALRRYRAVEPSDIEAPDPARRLLRTSAPVAFAQILAVVLANTPTWIVAALGERSDVGRFAAAAYILTLGSLLGSSLNSMFIGEYQSIASRRGFYALLRRLRRATIGIGMVGAVLSVLAFFIGPFLLASVYGRDFSFSPWFIASLTAAAILDPGTYVLNAGLLALNAYRNQFLVVAWALGLTLACILLCYLGDAPVLWAGAAAASTANAAKIAFSALAIARMRRNPSDRPPDRRRPRQQTMITPDQ